MRSTSQERRGLFLEQEPIEDGHLTNFNASVKGDFFGGFVESVCAGEAVERNVGFVIVGFAELVEVYVIVAGFVFAPLHIKHFHDVFLPGSWPVVFGVDSIKVARYRASVNASKYDL